MRHCLAQTLALALAFVGDACISQEPGRQLTIFPNGVFDTNERGDDGFHQRWYSKHLAAMHEPVLHTSPQRSDNAKVETYRFLWLRSFHHPVAIRVAKARGEDASLSIKELDGKGGYSPGKLMIERTKTLTSEEWSSLSKKIEECGFWKMSTTEQQWYVQEDGMIVAWGMTDGAQWILEGVKGNDYHVVHRQSPDDDNHRKAGKYRDTCIYFLSLSGLDMKKEPVY